MGAATILFMQALDSPICNAPAMQSSMYSPHSDSSQVLWAYSSIRLPSPPTSPLEDLRSPSYVTAAKDIAGAFDENGRGAVINSSRGIMCAYKKGGFDEKDYAVAARKEAIRMRDEINSVL